MSDNRQSWLIKNEAVLDDLVALMQLTVAEQQQLTALQSQAQAVAPELAEAFYGRLTNQPHMQEYLEGMVDHLKGTLQKWFVELFSGEYGETYVRDRLRIGEAHVRIGLPIRYPLAMIDLIVEYSEQVITSSSQPELTRQAFNKILALDIAIFSHAYEDTQLRHLAEMLGNERLARRILMK